jgi:hypothetical protein
MKMRKTVTLLLLGSVLVLSDGNLGAQEQPQPRASGVIPTGEKHPQFDFSFPGGTLAEFVAELNKTLEAQWKGAKPNLIFPTGAAVTRVPKLELRSVDLNSLMTAMNFLVDRRQHMWRQLTAGTWVLESTREQTKTQVFHVGDLLAKFKIDDINTALATVWEMSGDAKPELKYHQDTQLLIIRGERAELETALMVLTQLREGLPEKNPTTSTNEVKKR